MSDELTTGKSWVDWVRDKILPVALMGILGTGVAMYVKLSIIETKLDHIGVDDARQDVRLDDHENRLRDLERKP